MKMTGKLWWTLAGIVIAGVFIVSLVYLSMAPGARDVNPVKNNDSAGVVTGVYLNYHTSAETIYEDIVINGSRLTYTYFDHENATLDPHNVAQVALYNESDLKTIEANLSAGEVNRLINLINDTRFMSLNDTYGGASPGQRNYPYTITVKYGGSEKKVVYQSFPGASPMPEGFRSIQELLGQMVREKFGRQWAIR